MQKTLYIPIETTLDNTFECEKLIKRGDILTLTIKVFNNGALVDLTGQSIDLILKKSDNTIIQNTINSSNVSSGVVTTTLEQQSTLVSGTVSGELQIYTETTLTSTNTFTFEVQSSLADDVLEISKNDIKVLNDLRVLINQGQIEINEYKDNVLAIGNTVEAIEALANIKAYIDINLPGLENENAEAVININALKTENDKAPALTMNLKAENDKAPQLIIDLKAENNKTPNLIADLININDTAEELKNTLETDIINANASKEALNTSKTNADNTKNALDQSVEVANNFVEAHQDIENLINQVNSNTSQLSDMANIQGTETETDITSETDTFFNTDSLLLKGTFAINKRLGLFSPIKIFANKSARIKMINSASGGDIELGGNKIKLEKIDIETHAIQGLFGSGTITDSEIKECNITNDYTAGMGVQLANYIDGMKISKNTINAKGWAVLLNDGCTGKNLIIEDNKLFADGGDGIEINTPITIANQNNVIKGIKVKGNYINNIGSGTETNTNRGFGIGIAGGQNVIITDNIVEESRLEGLHLEDCIRNVIAKGNIFDNCNNHGITLAYKEKTDGTNTIYSIAPIISENTIKAKNNNKNYNGIYVIDNGGGSYKALIIKNNYIEGFNVGINTLDYSANTVGYRNVPQINADGCIINNCNIGVVASSRIRGTVICYNTPTLAQLRNDGVIDCIISATPITGINAFSWYASDGTSPATVKKFSFPQMIDSFISGTNTVDLLKLPRYMKGRIKVALRRGSDRVILLYDVEYKSSTLTATQLFADYNGAYDTPSLIKNGSNLAVQFYNGTGGTNLKAIVSFEGDYLVNA